MNVYKVASFTDAWIETSESPNCYVWRMSHLLQMRGLKQQRVRRPQSRKCRIFYRCVD